MNKRQVFLSSFLGALGAEEIKWTGISENYIEGTVIYDKSDPEEVQDFKWAMTELESPDNETQTLIDYIYKANLLDIDQLKKPVDDVRVPGLTDQQKSSAFAKLIDVQVRMVDAGEETDSYFIHK